MHCLWLSVFIVLEISNTFVCACLMCPSVTGRYCTLDVQNSGSNSHSSVNSVQSIINEAHSVSKEANAVSQEGNAIGYMNGLGLVDHYIPGFAINLLGKRTLPTCFDRCYPVTNLKEHQGYYSADLNNGLISQKVRVTKSDVSFTYDCRTQITLHYLPLPLTTMQMVTTSLSSATTTKVTTPLPTKISTTAAPVSSTVPMQLHTCSKLDTVSSLAHNTILLNSKFGCKNGKHGLSENVLMILCGAPESDRWTRGLKVIENCSRIPNYTAVAAFATSVYSHDGLAGVIIECNTTDIKIATEDCNKGMDIIHIKANARDSYTHNADSFYTVLW